MTVALGPGSGSRPPLPTEHVRAVVHGLRFQRPAFHLFRFPSGQGAGVHREDSATGRIDIVFDRNGVTRRLLTERAYNSYRISELVESVRVDPDGRWIAWPHRGADLAWRLAVWRIT